MLNRCRRAIAAVAYQSRGRAIFDALARAAAPARGLLMSVDDFRQLCSDVVAHADGQP